jgi:exodeoxyribonuclease VII large subunit
VTIADFIADLRAPTPSVAAELVVPEKEMLLRRKSDLDKALHRSLVKQIDKLNINIKQLMLRLKNPKKKIQEIWLRLDDLGGRLGRSLTLRIRHSSDRLHWLVRRLEFGSPRMQLQKYEKQLELITNNFLLSFNKNINNKSTALRELTIRLNASNPLAILDRGYSVTRTLVDKRVVTHPDQTALHDHVEVLLAGGTLLCDIQGKSIHGEKDI